VVGLSSLGNITYADACEGVRRSLLAGEPWVATSWSEEELTMAEGLVSSKFGVDTWNLFL